jgi:hypothetical protein
MRALPKHGANRRWSPTAAGLSGWLAGLLIGLAGVRGNVVMVRAADPQLSVATTISAEPGARVPFRIRVTPEAPRDSFVRLRGLPSTSALSDGYAIAAGSWTVALDALPDLYITLAPAPEGPFAIRITLLRGDGAVLNEVRCTLIVAATPLLREAAPGSADMLKSGVAESLSLQAPAPVPVMSPENRARAAHFLEKGDELLAEGNIAPARLLYERAIGLGLAQAAMALAATYDPSELSKLNVQGIAPDIGEARRWYERARELGAEVADDRLRRLDAK